MTSHFLPPPSMMPLARDFFKGPYAAPRRRMMLDNLWKRDVRDLRVLEAMALVPRHEFVPPSQRDEAYEDHPLGIGHGQTISQPYMVARMTELAQVRPGARVLEIGVGSGYQTAVLQELGAVVYGMEIVEPLATAAAATLERLGYANFNIVCGDGSGGWPGEAPFEVILIAAAPERAPRGLLGQLTPGGRLIAPIGPLDDQYLYVFTCKPQGFVRRACFAVRFVPMTGAVEED